MKKEYQWALSLLGGFILMFLIFKDIITTPVLVKSIIDKVNPYSNLVFAIVSLIILTFLFKMAFNLGGKNEQEQDNKEIKTEK